MKTGQEVGQLKHKATGILAGIAAFFIAGPLGTLVVAAGHTAANGGVWKNKLGRFYHWMRKGLQPGQRAVGGSSPEMEANGRMSDGKVREQFSNGEWFTYDPKAQKAVDDQGNDVTARLQEEVQAMVANQQGGAESQGRVAPEITQ